MALYNAVNLTSQIPTFSIQKQKDGIQIGDSTYGCFRIGPFKSTKSLTFANLLRRTLLHEIPGTGITQVTFQLPTHEFSTLPGVQESVIDILLNLKQIVFQGYCGSYTRGTLCKQGPATITANDLQLPYPLIVNSPNQSIAHVSSGFEFKMDFILKTAKGSSLPLLKKSVAASSSLLVQNDFNPIKKVNYTICEERLKEWIELEIWTNGSIQPYLALQTAVQNILCEFDSLYPKTLHLHSRILEYGEYKSKIENRNKLENSFFPIDLYTGLKYNQLLNFLKYDK
jgi:DNA-directed RNA polymerase subunit alpha